MTDFKKGDETTFLDYKIKFCTNGDGIVLYKDDFKHTYETHLGNYSTLDEAQKAAVVFFMIARPEHFATQIMLKVMKQGSGCYHEWFKLKKVLEKEKISMPKELEVTHSPNFMILYNEETIKF